MANEQLNELLQRAEKLNRVIDVAKELKEIRAPSFAKAEREMRKEIGDILVKAANQDHKNRNRYVEAIADNYKLAGEYNKAQIYLQELEERRAGRWNSDNPKFYSLMLNEHMEELDYKGRVKYLSKVLDKPRLLSSNLKNVIYNEVKLIGESIEESYSDDVREIRHNYGACEDSSEASSQANHRYRRNMGILEPLEEKISKMKEVEYKDGGAAI
jgi:hypothetical protein